ncbi:MAG: Gfo/Idh/MocA family oxidoreductase [Verrucomicrobiota bacterium]|nr:Gfo/Idh/MocA family oxidoreductase [Verrucomicrobiota bacterium]
MNNQLTPPTGNRRDFIKTTSSATAASVLTGVAIPRVHSAVDDTTQVVVVGAGGRGTGAADNALSVPGNIARNRLVAMADVSTANMDNSYKALKRRHKDKVDVPADRRYIGFDGYAKAMDHLKTGDVVIFTTPCAFRWVHFQRAIEKGLNVFMEKPVCPDGPTARRMFELNKEAKKKNLKVGVGLMCRHSRARGELFNRIKDGEMGEINLLRAYRLHGPVASCYSLPPKKNESELLYQIRRFHSFLWASGGSFSDYFIHNIDECCWMKDAWPVKAQGAGGRHYRGDYVDQNLDAYTVEYTFADGAKLYMHGRTMPGCFGDFASYAHGSKGLGIISMRGHAPAPCKIFKGQSMKDEVAWAYPGRESNPYQDEWNDLMTAIREDTPFNEVDRGVMASVVTAAGRFAAHTGQEITVDQVLNHDHDLSPDSDKLTMDSPAPLQMNPDGKYPVPQPGIIKDREYLQINADKA